MAILKSFQKFVASKKNGWLFVLLILIVLLTILQTTRKAVKYEGFQQREPFSIQRGTDAYDEFYSEIYDRLYKNESRSEKEAMEIIRSTQPDKANSYFLDIGCGTGCLVNALKRRGYNSIGIDKSSAMIETGKDRHTEIKDNIKKCDALDAMSFDRGMFTHILCMDRTVYEMEDKVLFFRNCKYWLQPGGYLILHLVEPDKFNATIPLGQPTGLLKDTDDLKTADGKRVTNTLIDFLDFKYKSSYDFSQYKNDGTVVQVETFTDATTNKVRQNEHTFYMSQPKTVLEELRYCGFLLTGEFVSTEDKYQKIYILKAL